MDSNKAVFEAKKKKNMYLCRIVINMFKFHP